MKSFNHVKLSELDFELESETTESGRTYKTPGGKSYPSITTVLSNYNKQTQHYFRSNRFFMNAKKLGKIFCSTVSHIFFPYKEIVNEMNAPIINSPCFKK